MPIYIGMTWAGKGGAASSAARFEVGALWGVPAEGVLEDPARGCKQGEAFPFCCYICGMPFFTKSNLVDLRAEAEQLSICVEHFLYASEHINEGDYKTKGFYDNCIEKCNGRLKAIHFLMESIRQDRPVSEDELQESLPDFLNCKKDAK